MMMKNEYAEARGMVVKWRKVSFTKCLFLCTVFILFNFFLFFFLLKGCSLWKSSSGKR
jgi:hypothetical protein